MNNESKSQTTHRRPAEVFHPSVFIREEMRARRWSRRKLAERMGGNVAVNMLSIDLYFDVGPKEPNLRIGDGENFARALGVRAEFFRNLETAWLQSHGVQD